MKLLINSDGSMALDGDAAELAEFALAMRRSTSNKLMPGVAEPAFDEPQPQPQLGSKRTSKPSKPMPADPIPLLSTTHSATSDRLLQAMSMSQGRTLVELAESTSMATMQIRNLLGRMREKGHVVSDGGSPELWIRAVNIPAADKSNKRAIGSNHEFALRICNDGWISRVDIIAAAEKAGLNGKSFDVALPTLLDRGLLERRKLSPGGVEYRATPSTLSTS